MELPKLNIDDKILKEKVIEVLSPLHIDENKCKKLVSVFEDEIQRGNICRRHSVTNDHSYIRIGKWSLCFKFANGKHLYSRAAR